jgi:hypothetical protein
VIRIPSLFVGAGGVAPLGLPTLVGLESRILRLLDDSYFHSDRADIYRMIKVERSKQGRRSDLEGVMAVVTNSVDPTQSPSHIQRVFSAVKRRTGLSISELTHEMQRIRSQVENLINDSLYIDASEKIVTHYRHVKRVFSTISDEIGCEAIDVDRIGDLEI